METLVLVSGSEEIHLHGVEVMPTVRGARRVGCAAVEGGWRESVEVYLEGRPGEMQAARERIERMLRRVERETVFMRMAVYAGAETVEARLANGTCSAMDPQVESGTGGLRLELVRYEAWQGAERTLPLNNPGGEGVSTGIEIYTHTDAGHWNYADIRAEALPGDWPGILRLELENAGGLESLGDARMCLDAGPAPFQAGLALEGEAARGGNRVEASECSGGAARAVEVTGTAGVLLTWTVESGLAARLAGRVVRPAVRFAVPPADGAVWAWWRVSRDGAALWESGRELLDGKGLQDLPVLALPGLDTPAGVELELWGKSSGLAASFSLDFVQLCPLDGWRSYGALAGLPPGEVLVDDGYSGRVYAVTAAGEVGSYAGSGPEPRLLPERDQRLYLLHDDSANLPLRLRLRYRPAWASL